MKVLTLDKMQFLLSLFFFFNCRIVKNDVSNRLSSANSGTYLRLVKLPGFDTFRNIWSTYVFTE